MYVCVYSIDVCIYIYIYIDFGDSTGVGTYEMMATVMWQDACSN